MWRGYEGCTPAQSDPLLILAAKRRLRLNFRRAKTFAEQFAARFDTYEYTQARREAMRRVTLPIDSVGVDI